CATAAKPGTGHARLRSVPPRKRDLLAIWRDPTVPNASGSARTDPRRWGSTGWAECIQCYANWDCGFRNRWRTKNRKNPGQVHRITRQRAQQKNKIFSANQCPSWERAAPLGPSAAAREVSRDCTQASHVAEGKP